MGKSINALAKMIAKEVQIEVINKVSSEIHSVVDEEITKFYDDVNPTYYDRNGSLYDTYKDLPVEKTPEGNYRCGVVISSDFMDLTQHNKERSIKSYITNDELFSYTFKRGYHGWHEHKSDMASRVRSKAPLEEIEKRYQALKRKMNQFVSEAVSKAINKHYK